MKGWLLGLTMLTAACTPKPEIEQPNAFARIMEDETISVEHIIRADFSDIKKSIQKKTMASRREVTADIYLDGVSQAVANSLLFDASETYQQQFNIAFSANSFSEYCIKDTVDFNKIPYGPAEVAILFTEKDIVYKNYAGNVCGQAHPDGMLWLEARGDYQLSLLILLHELSHIFNAKHVTDSTAVMYAYADRTQRHWSASSWNTIALSKDKIFYGHHNNLLRAAYNKDHLQKFTTYVKANNNLNSLLNPAQENQ